MPLVRVRVRVRVRVGIRASSACRARPSPRPSPDPHPAPTRTQGFDDSNGDAFDVSLKPFLKGNERPLSLGDTIFTTAEGDDARSIRWKVRTRVERWGEVGRGGARWGLRAQGGYGAAASRPGRRWAARGRQAMWPTARSVAAYRRSTKSRNCGSF